MWLVFHLANQKHDFFKVEKNEDFTFTQSKDYTMQSYVSLCLNLKLSWQRLETAKMEEIHKCGLLVILTVPLLVIKRHTKTYGSPEMWKVVKGSRHFHSYPNFLIFRLSPFDFKTLLPSAGAGSRTCASNVLRRHCTTDLHPWFSFFVPLSLPWNNEYIHSQGKRLNSHRDMNQKTKGQQFPRSSPGIST